MAAFREPHLGESTCAVIRLRVSDVAAAGTGANETVRQKYNHPGGHSSLRAGTSNSSQTFRSIAPDFPEYVVATLAKRHDSVRAAKAVPIREESASLILNGAANRSGARLMLISAMRQSSYDSFG